MKIELHDRIWRLQNLYTIKDQKTGAIIKFVPRPEQMRIYRALESGIRKIIILKARRLGFSTAIDVLAADEATFNNGRQISIVDQNKNDAAKKLNSICKIAYAGLPAALRAHIVPTRDNDSAFELSVRGEDATSGIYAGTNARGGTNQLLHISEWGVIQSDDPKRSEEILTGALPSAKEGVTIIETTWKGGRHGHLWGLVKQALEIPPEQRTPSDWHIFFFPWYTDPSCTATGHEARIDPEIALYFAEKEEEISNATGEPFRFTEAQKLWYAREKATYGIFMFREFPTTIDECFRSPIDGAIYASLIDKVRGQGAILPFPVDGSALVHTFWDKGSPINTVTWYVQFVGYEIRVIDVDMSTEDAPLDLTPVQRVARLLAKGYNYGMHFLPHDAAATLTSGRTFQNELEDAGLRNTRIIPRTHDVWTGINRLRSLFPRLRFRIPATEHGIDALSNYHTRITSTSGKANDEPVHDWSSHAADGLRMMAEAEMHNLIPGNGASSGGRGAGRAGVVTRAGSTQQSSSRVDLVERWMNGGKKTGGVVRR